MGHPPYSTLHGRRAVSFLFGGGNVQCVECNAMQCNVMQCGVWGAAILIMRKDV